MSKPTNSGEAKTENRERAAAAFAAALRPGSENVATIGLKPGRGEIEVRDKGLFEFVTVRIAPDAEPIPLGDDVYLPSGFSAEIDDPAFPVVALDVALRHGRPEVTALRVQAREGERVTHESLRLPVADFLRETARHLVSRLSTGADGAVIYVPSEIFEEGQQGVMGFDPETGRLGIELSSDASDQLRRDLLVEQTLEHAKRRRVNRERLERVAVVYRRARAAGQSTSEAVERDQRVSRSRAGALVVQARKEGILGPTRRGRAGEDG